MRKVLILAAVAALTLSACSTTPDTARRDRLGVQATTMALIERADNPADKAARVIEAVEATRTMLELTDVSVGDLKGALLTRVAERYEAGKLTPLERLAALEVITEVSAEVERRLGLGVLTADTRVKVNTVLDWVEDSARIYVPVKRDT